MRAGLGLSGVVSANGIVGGLSSNGFLFWLSGNVIFIQVSWHLYGVGVAVSNPEYF